MNVKALKQGKLWRPFTLISYSCLLALVVPASISGILEAAVLVAAGMYPILSGKATTPHGEISRGNLVSSVAIAAYLAWCFYDKWMLFFSTNATIAKLHLPAAPIAIVGAAVLSLLAVYVLSAICKQIGDVFRAPLANDLSHLSICILSAAAVVIIAQLALGLAPFCMLPSRFALGTLIVLIPILLLCCIFGRIKIPIIATSAVYLLLSIINAYVYSFRTRLLEPTDIFSFGTAMNVADNYNLWPVPTGVWFALAVWAALTVCVLRTKSDAGFSFSVKKRCIVLTFCLIASVSSVLAASSMKIYHWQRQGAEMHGYILDLTTKLRELFPDKPQGYSIDKITEISKDYPLSTDTTEDPPHIIVIMDEAFSDLSVLGELNTNVEELTPFISSMKENTISGYTLVSVYGGNTSNSEYELLTGNTMAWLSPNSVPYQQYLSSPTYSMISYLKTYYDYQCIAMHPHYSSGWNRPVAYAGLGFDEVVFKDGYPHQDIVRTYVSDREAFETLIASYEKNKSAATLHFCVTMQNHGGYRYEGDNFTPNVSLSGYNGTYPDVEQYLSLITETDRAVEYLISYFSEAEEDVIVLFYGDHQPKLDSNFISEISGGAAEQQDLFKVPFFIWANYDIEEMQVECTSLNYLSTYLYNAAGIALPPYNQFLQELEAVIPAINANGFWSSSARAFVSFDQATNEEKQWLNTYKLLQYNNAFDKKNRNNSMFPVLEK